MILVTGANGFVGKALCKVLRERGFKAELLFDTLEWELKQMIFLVTPW